VKEKELASESDVQAHIRADWKTVHGLWEKIRPLILTLGKSVLVYDNNADGYITKLLIQVGSVTASSTTVTWDVPYKTGTTPFVFGITDDQRCFCVVTSKSATGCVIKSVRSTTEGVVSALITWIAIGEIT
jgi:hypothetical protein